VYLLNAEVTIQWELLPTATPPALSELDLLIIPPYGDNTYLDAPIAVEDYLLPTVSTNGMVTYKFTPQDEGFWRIRLVTGTVLSNTILSKIEMFVFDNTTTTTPYFDDVGKPLPYDINFFLQGFLVPDEIFGVFVASRYINLATDAPGSRAVAEEPPSATDVVLKIFYNEQEIGNVTFPVLSKAGFITLTATPIIPGGRISIISQGAVMDANIRDIAINLVGCCTVIQCSAI